MGELPVPVDKLCAAMKQARMSLVRFRQERREAVRQYVGSHWSEEGADAPVPVNLLSLYVSIVGNALVAKNPRVMLSTFSRTLKPAVSAMQSWANREIEEMRLADTLRRVVVDALFSVGICKVALATPAESAAAAWNLRAGRPFAERVDLDDFVYDIHARDQSNLGYIGHRYRVPLKAVRRSKIYASWRKGLSASEDKMFNLEGDERVAMLGRGYYSNREEYEDMIDLWEVYLPRERLVYTLIDYGEEGPSYNGQARPLRVQRWLGPDHGPYHILSLGVVPDNFMPKAPIQDLIDLHLETNKAFRKLMRTASDLKDVVAVGQGSTEDAKRLIDANHMQATQVRSAESIKQILFGQNAIQPLMLVAPLFKDLFSFMGGNLELLGGRSPQSKTATQDKMLDENAGAGVADMQQRTTDFVAGALKGLCWYWWHDPFRTMKTRHQIPGAPELEIERQVSPLVRQMGRFEELDIRVDPYSMQHQTPQTRMAALNQVVQTVVIPMMPLLQQQGIAFDVNAWLAKMAQYMDLPDLTDIITVREPPQQAPGGGEAPGMPQQTERTYNRVSMPGRTQQGNDLNMRSALMGVNPGGQQNGKVGV